MSHDIPTSSFAPQNSRLLQKLLVFGGQGKCLLSLHLEAAYFSNLEVLEAWNRCGAQTLTAEERAKASSIFWGGNHYFKSWPLKTMQNRCIDAPTCTKSKQKNRRFKKSPPKKPRNSLGNPWISGFPLRENHVKEFEVQGISC